MQEETFCEFREAVKPLSASAAALARLQLQPRPCIFLMVERVLNVYLAIKSNGLDATSGSGNP